MRSTLESKHKKLSKYNIDLQVIRNRTALWYKINMPRGA